MHSFTSTILLFYYQTQACVEDTHRSSTFHSLRVEIYVTHDDDSYRWELFLSTVISYYTILSLVDSIRSLILDQMVDL